MYLEGLSVLHICHGPSPISFETAELSSGNGIQHLKAWAFAEAFATDVTGFRASGLKRLEMLGL